MMPDCTAAIPAVSSPPLWIQKETLHALWCLTVLRQFLLSLHLLCGFRKKHFMHYDAWLHCGNSCCLFTSSVDSETDTLCTMAPGSTSCCLCTSSVDSEKNTSCTITTDSTAVTPAVSSPPLWTQKETLHALWCLTALRQFLLSLHLLCGFRKKHFMHYDAWLHCGNSCCLFTSSVDSERNTSCTMMPDCTAAIPAVSSPPLWIQKETLHALWCLTALRQFLLSLHLLCGFRNRHFMHYGAWQHLLLSLHLLCGFRKKHFMHYNDWQHCSDTCCLFTSSVDSEKNTSCTITTDSTAVTPAVSSPPLWTQKKTLHAL